MPFHIQPIREFLVRPALPDALSRMTELAYNILWSWEPIIRALFRRLDPGAVARLRLQPGAHAGPGLPGHPAEGRRRPPLPGALPHRRAKPTMRACARAPAPADGKLIAYFSAEYGLTECLPVYSGGLGILSGDHLKSSSDQDYPLIGLGLLYQQGYFRQLLNPDGWQQERYPDQRFLHPAADP